MYSKQTTVISGKGSSEAAAGASSNVAFVTWSKLSTSTPLSSTSSTTRLAAASTAKTTPLPARPEARTKETVRPASQRTPEGAALMGGVEGNGPVSEREEKRRLGLFPASSIRRLAPAVRLPSLEAWPGRSRWGGVAGGGMPLVLFGHVFASGLEESRKRKRFTRMERLSRRRSCLHGWAAQCDLSRDGSGTARRGRSSTQSQSLAPAQVAPLTLHSTTRANKPDSQGPPAFGRCIHFHLCRARARY